MKFVNKAVQSQDCRCIFRAESLHEPSVEDVKLAEIAVEGDPLVAISPRIAFHRLGASLKDGSGVRILGASKGAHIEMSQMGGLAPILVFVLEQRRI